MTEPTIELSSQLLACLAVAVSGSPGVPQQICLRVGSEVAHDMGQFEDLCCRGLAYVSMGDTFPSSDSFPEQDIVRQANTVCAPPSWAQQFKLGIVRCVPVAASDDTLFEPPTCTQWTAAAIQNMYDSASLRRAVCCFRNWLRAQTGFFLGMSLVIDRQIQVNPNGGCVERYVTVTVQFPNCDCD
jgi:hypothetical protein